MRELTTDSIGEAWLESCRYIFRDGHPMEDEGKMLREMLHFVLEIKNPKEDDKIIEKYADKAMIEWMLSNFFEQKMVPELKNGLSYGTRLFNYNGKNQVEWVIEKLKQKPESKSATITMLMPNQDVGYIPCVSMLDFKIRGGRLMVVAMCRSLDFGSKVYANMIALHRLQQMISKRLDVPSGELVIYVVSAHIYDDDYNKIKAILEKTEKAKNE